MRSFGTINGGISPPDAHLHKAANSNVRTFTLKQPVPVKFPVAFTLAILVLGLVPAAVILFLFQMNGQGLVFLGKTIDGYDLTRLFAAVLSTAGPLFILLPVAVMTRAGDRTWRFWIWTALLPLLLGVPSLLAGWAIGGRGSEPLAALFWLMVLVLVFSLWLEVLRRVLTPSFAVLLYGVFWAISGFIHYLNLYVAPYETHLWPRAVDLLGWILPAVDTETCILHK